KKTKRLLDSNHLKALKNFNEMEKNNKLSTLFKESQQLNESAVKTSMRVGKEILTRLGTMGTPTKIMTVLGLIGFSLTFIRALIFTYYNSRVRISQYLKFLQDFVEMNASTLVTDA